MADCFNGFGSDHDFLLSIDANHWNNLFKSWHESWIESIKCVVLGYCCDGIENSFKHGVIHSWETIFENLSQRSQNLINVFVHDFDFFIFVLRKSFFKVLNTQSTFILNFRIAVIKTFANKLQDKISIVLLNLRGKLFRHIAHSYNNIDDKSGVGSVKNRKDKTKNIFKLSFVGFMAVFSQNWHASKTSMLHVRLVWFEIFLDMADK